MRIRHLMKLCFFGIATKISSGIALPSQKPVKKVAVIGAGIAGLSVAHSFLNQNNGFSEISFDLFDRRVSFEPSSSSGGAGIQLNGGLSVLGRINPQLRDLVYDAGLPQTRIRSTCKSWKPNDDIFDTLFEIDVGDLIRTSKGADDLLCDDKQRVWWTTVMRNDVQRVLFEALPPENSVMFNKQLIDVRAYDGEDGCSECVFSDGSTSGPYDVVIGCEGINSVTKNIVDEKPIGSTEKTAIYSGIRIRYAVSNLQKEDETSASLTQHFGNGAYALNGIYGAGSDGSRTRCIYIVYLDPNTVGPFQRSENARHIDRVVEENPDWVESKVSSLKEDMIEQLESAGICSKELSETIERSERFFELGSYFHTPFGRWSKQIGDKGAWVTLCGDSAHALPPFLGQGSNQAIQDAFCLTEAIRRYNYDLKQGDASLGEYLTQYERIRWPSIFDTLWKAAFLGYLETGGPGGFYAKFRDLFFKTLFMIGFVKRVLINAAKPNVD